MDVFASRSPLSQATELPTRTEERVRGGFIRKSKPNLSASDIRAKVAAKFAKEQAEKQPAPAAKAEVSQQTKKSAEAIKQAKMDSENAGDTETKDLNRPGALKNDPTDAMTSEKLKKVLDMGAFKFSDKERAVLGKILSK